VKAERRNSTHAHVAKIFPAVCMECINAFTCLVQDEIKPNMSSECTGKQDLVCEPVMLPEKGQTAFKMADPRDRKIKTRSITCQNVPGATRRDSLIVAQARPNQATLSELEDGYGKNVIILWAIEKWITSLGGCRTDLVDSARSERSRDTETVGAVRGLMSGERHLPRKKIASMLGIHHKNVKFTLCDYFNMCKLNLR
jgi:hypothetical protein